MKKQTSLTVVSTITLALTSSLSQAAFVTPQSWTRGAGGTTYQHWDVFGTMTDAAPDAGSINPNGNPTLTETSGGAFITGGGNIYGFGVAPVFSVAIPELDVPTPAHNVSAVVQIKVQGTELDLDSVQLNGTAATDYAELFRQTLGGFGGALVEHWFLFAIPYASFGDGIPGVEELSLTFAGEETHMSLDQLAVDTAIRPFGFYNEPNPIPEPTSLLMAVVGGIAMLSRRLCLVQA